MAINTPTGWDVDLKSIMGWLSDKKRDELLEMLKQDKRERERRKEREIWKIWEIIMLKLKRVKKFLEINQIVKWK